MAIAIIEKTKEYVVIKVPRKMWAEFDVHKKNLSETQALAILKAGMKEFKKGKTRTLISLRSLRHAN